MIDCIKGLFYAPRLLRETQLQLASAVQRLRYTQQQLDNLNRKQREQIDPLIAKLASVGSLRFTNHATFRRRFWIDVDEVALTKAPDPRFLLDEIRTRFERMLNEEAEELTKRQGKGWVKS